MISKTQRRLVYERSQEMCEGMMLTGRVWARCWDTPIEIHHLLTRARGGGCLDSVDEIYHLIALCSQHHRDSDGGAAYAAGLLIDGYVTMDKVRRRPVYVGTDNYLKEKYGAK